MAEELLPFVLNPGAPFRSAAWGMEIARPPAAKTAGGLLCAITRRYRTMRKVAALRTLTRFMRPNAFEREVRFPLSGAPRSPQNDPEHVLPQRFSRRDP
jgi:hypothetical protein